MTPRAAALFALLLVTSPAVGQPVNLTETPQPGDCSRYAVDLNLTGNLIVTQEGKRQELKINARARHAFAERTLAVADGMPSRSVRQFEAAAAVAEVGGDTEKHGLPDDRKLFVVQRNADALFCFCPAGPVSRDELDLVAEHFNPQ